MRNINKSTAIYEIRIILVICSCMLISNTILYYHRHSLNAFVVDTQIGRAIKTFTTTTGSCRTTNTNNHDRIRQRNQEWYMTPIPSSFSSLQNVTTTGTSKHSSPPPPPQTQQQQQERPIPAMPSLLFQQLAYSQMELLASSLVGKSRRYSNTVENNGSATPSTSSSYSTTTATATTSPMNSKSKSIVLYLPQENRQTGQLEFLPMIIYPYQNERIFIANAWNSGIPPIIPNVITKLPGFAHATTLLPRYPMIYTSRSYSDTVTTIDNENKSLPNSQQLTSEPGIGRVEEVYCDWRLGTVTSLSVPLLIGSQTVGVLLVSPQIQQQNEKQPYTTTTNERKPFWTDYDRQQVARAATSLSLALSMDNERQSQQKRDIEMEQQKQFYNSLSDNLHQLKNPIQALRTYGKLLQRRLVEISKSTNDTTTTFASSASQTEDIDTVQLLELADHLMKQSDRIVERLKPVDTIIEHINNSNHPSVVALLPSAPSKQQQQSIVPYIPRLLQQDDSSRRPTWEVDTNSYSSATNIDAAILDRMSDDAAVRWSPTETTRNDTDELLHKPIPQDQFAKNDNDTDAFATLPFHQNRDNMNINPLLVDDRKEMAFVMDVLEPIFHDFHTIATEQNIDFRVIMDDSDNIPGVSIYPKALQEVMINLLDNAFKYVRVVADDNDRATTNADPNRKPQVRVRIYPNELIEGSKRPGVTIIVEDNGPGIAKDETECIFDRGYRNQQISSKVAGSGIGLSIAKSYVESMGGTLRTVLLLQNMEHDRTIRRSFTSASTSAASLPYLSGAVMELILFR